MQRYVEVINSSKEFESPTLQVHRGRLPVDVCQALHQQILSQPERKVIYTLGRDPKIPDTITAAVPHIPYARTGNTVITKKYNPMEDSGAFTMHRDPTQYADHPLILCTLGGRAILSVADVDQRIVQIECTPNTIVVAHNNPLHAVTPPLDGEIRTFMFIGADLTQGQVAPTSRT